MMKKTLLSLIVTAFTTAITAQNEFNLVPNYSFEDVEKRIKGGGEIYMAAPWKAVTSHPVDLYSADAKSADYGVPENKYGQEKARTGVNYAGVAFFGYRGRLPRTYLGTELSAPLDAGKEYCVKFHFSLSDLSKYAVNNLGVYLSNEAVEDATDGNLSFEPQIMSITNDVQDKQFLWESICGRYTAKGGEQHIIIGNFFSDDKTEQETLRMSREFSGRQNYDSYYFIDDVSVIPTDKIGEKECSCDKIAGGGLKVEYKSFGTDEEKRASAKKTYIVNSDGSNAKENMAKKQEKSEVKTFSSSTPAAKEEAPFDINKTEIYFDNKAFNPQSTEQDKINKIIDYLNNNADKNIELIGHSDDSESDVKALGRRRAFMVKKVLVDSGIATERITYKDAGTANAKSDAAKNQRLSIRLK